MINPVTPMNEANTNTSFIKIHEGVSQEIDHRNYYMTPNIIFNTYYTKI